MSNCGCSRCKNVSCFYIFVRQKFNNVALCNDIGNSEKECLNGLTFDKFLFIRYFTPNNILINRNPFLKLMTMREKYSEETSVEIGNVYNFSRNPKKKTNFWRHVWRRVTL